MNITIHQVRDLALKILGLICVLKLVLNVARAAHLATLVNGSTYPGNAASEMWSEVAVTVFYLLATYFLLFRTQYLLGLIWRDSETDLESLSAPRIATAEFWVRLIGVYFLIWSIADLASVIWQWLPGFRRDPSFTSDFTIINTLRSGVMLLLSIVCVRWPDAPFRLFRPVPQSDEEMPSL
ncbi:MAG: hypothetical protein IT365_14835 [Candidatus Hydrogenedentes bacterium]|nr:hypothetical protein [Candidatus Hydrogenedentota bacterium]